MYEKTLDLGRRSRFHRAGVAPTAPWASRHRISKAPWPRSPSTASPKTPSRSTSAPKLDTIGKFESAGGSRLFSQHSIGNSQPFHREGTFLHLWAIRRLIL